MRATTFRLTRARRLITASVITSVFALATLGGSALAADSRDFTVTVDAPSKVSQGGVTAFFVHVDSRDNQTISNVKLRIPGTPNADPAHLSPAPWPSLITITAVFGADAGNCTIAPDGHSVLCLLGNIRGFGHKTLTVLASVPSTVPVNSPPPTPAPAPIKFSASAETNNENGSNRQVVTSPDSSPLEVVKSDANARVHGE